MEFNEIVEILRKEYDGFLIYAKNKSGNHTSINNLHPFEIIGFAELQKQNTIKFCNDTVEKEGKK